MYLNIYPGERGEFGYSPWVNGVNMDIYQGEFGYSPWVNGVNMDIYLAMVW